MNKNLKSTCLVLITMIVCFFVWHFIAPVDPRKSKDWRPVLIDIPPDFYPATAHAQGGSRITELTEDTSPAGEDLVLTVDDPSGTPANKKATRINFIGTLKTGFALNAATTADDFLVFRAPVDIRISNIHGVLLSGTNVVGGFEECASTGASCANIDADITFDGGLDSDDGSLSNPTVDAGDWVKWHTTSVSSPGYLTVTIFYKIE